MVGRLNKQASNFHTFSRPPLPSSSSYRPQDRFQNLQGPVQHEHLGLFVHGSLRPPSIGPLHRSQVCVRLVALCGQTSTSYPPPFLAACFPESSLTFSHVRCLPPQPMRPDHILYKILSHLLGPVPSSFKPVHTLSQ